MIKRYLPLLAVALLLVLGIGAWFMMHPDGSPQAPQPSNNSSSSVYQNDAYGFTLSYPKNLSPEGVFRKYYALSDKWRAEAPEGQPGTALVSIPVFRVDNQGDSAVGKPYPLYFTAEVRVGASADPQAVADCLKPDEGYTDQAHETVTLNGVQFERFEFGNAAMMQYVQGISYRTVRDNTCFAIEQLKAGSSYKDETMLPGIPDDQLSAYYSEAGDIARTFRFDR